MLLNSIIKKTVLAIVIPKCVATKTDAVLYSRNCEAI